jgi:hypothetical protein
MCVRTVASLRCSRVAISVLDRPRARRTSTWRSRSVIRFQARDELGGGLVQSQVTFDQSPGHAWCKQRVSGGDGPYRGVQGVAGSVLEQEAAGTGTQRSQHVFVEVECGEYQYPAASAGVATDLGGGGDAVQIGHAHIHEYDIRPVGSGQVNRFAPGGRLGNDLEIGLGAEHRGRAKRCCPTPNDPVHATLRARHERAATITLTPCSGHKSPKTP